MHILESYSLQTGAKIDKPFIIQKFFPLSVDKYIVIQPFSKQSKSYDYWPDVIRILKPLLSKNGIEIVQIGAKGETPLNGCYSTVGQTNLGQSAYIISNSELFLGADSFGAHIASSFGKKIVALYSNNYLNCVRPYWTEEKDCILIEPESRTHSKPSFSMTEIPKTINEIKPERIAAAVCSLLNIEYDFKYITQYIGANYTNRFIESLPNQILNPAQFGIDSIVVRMDFLFNENLLAQQLNSSKCTIVTNKRINKDILKTFKHNIKDIIYTVNEVGQSDFLHDVGLLNINTFILSNATGQLLNDIKLEYLDYGNINIKPDYKQDIEKLKSSGKKLYYLSAKYTLSEGRIFPSYAAFLNDKDIPAFDYEPQEVIDCKEFWDELEHFTILTID